MLASGLVLMMPTMLLSGMIFPVESMPWVLQGISAAIPARWYIQAVRKLMIQGVDVVNVTYGQLADPRRFEALSQLVAQKLGVPHREKTAGQRAAAERLRAEVFVDWVTLPFA